ncbi:MAG: hypothetical protein K0A98_00520 [Trueperaceae bacterium]|nr:hypothetical protein [Trueperaceae bacterium]
MYPNDVLPYGAAYAAQLREEANVARLRTQAQLPNPDRLVIARALLGLARRIARFAERIEPTAMESANRRPARPDRRIRTTA